MDVTYVGLNLTSQLIEVAVRPTGERWKTDFADENISAMATKLKDIQPELVVMEANGTFELSVAGILATQGLRFALVNPRNIREFARAIVKRSRIYFRSNATGWKTLPRRFRKVCRITSFFWNGALRPWTRSSIAQSGPVPPGDKRSE